MIGNRSGGGCMDGEQGMMGKWVTFLRINWGGAGNGRYMDRLICKKSFANFAKRPLWWGRKCGKESAIGRASAEIRPLFLRFCGYLGGFGAGWRGVILRLRVVATGGGAGGSGGAEGSEEDAGGGGDPAGLAARR